MHALRRLVLNPRSPGRFVLAAPFVVAWVLLVLVQQLDPQYTGGYQGGGAAAIFFLPIVAIVIVMVRGGSLLLTAALMWLAIMMMAFAFDGTPGGVEVIAESAFYGAMLASGLTMVAGVISILASLAARMNRPAPSTGEVSPLHR